MYLDVKVRLSNKVRARHLVDTIAMWLKCSFTPPLRIDGRQSGNPVIPMRGRPDGSGQFAIEIPDYERTKK